MKNSSLNLELIANIIELIENKFEELKKDTKFMDKILFLKLFMD